MSSAWQNGHAPPSFLWNPGGGSGFHWTAGEIGTHPGPSGSLQEVRRSGLHTSSPGPGNPGTGLHGRGLRIRIRGTGTTISANRNAGVGDRESGRIRERESEDPRTELFMGGEVPG
jgi:hypothetical protein